MLSNILRVVWKIFYLIQRHTHRPFFPSGLRPHIPRCLGVRGLNWIPSTCVTHYGFTFWLCQFEGVSLVRVTFFPRFSFQIKTIKGTTTLDRFISARISGWKVFYAFSLLSTIQNSDICPKSWFILRYSCSMCEKEIGQEDTFYKKWILKSLWCRS